jgi:hypothetical protein
MNVPRDELSACVITGLPNTHDYIQRQRVTGEVTSRTIGSGNSEKPKDEPRQEH